MSKNDRHIQAAEDKEDSELVDIDYAPLSPSPNRTQFEYRTEISPIRNNERLKVSPRRLQESYLEEEESEDEGMILSCRLDTFNFPLIVSEILRLKLVEIQTKLALKQAIRRRRESEQRISNSQFLSAKACADQSSSSSVPTSDSIEVDLKSTPPSSSSPPQIAQFEKNSILTTPTKFFSGRYDEEVLKRRKIGSPTVTYSLSPGSHNMRPISPASTNTPTVNTAATLVDLSKRVTRDTTYKLSGSSSMRSQFEIPSTPPKKTKAGLLTIEVAKSPSPRTHVKIVLLSSANFNQ